MSTIGMNQFTYEDLIKKLILVAMKNNLKIVSRDPNLIPYIKSNNDMLQFITTEDEKLLEPQDWYEVEGTHGGCTKTYTKGYFVEICADLKLLNRMDFYSQEYLLHEGEYFIQNQDIRIPHERPDKPSFKIRFPNR